MKELGLMEYLMAKEYKYIYYLYRLKYGLMEQLMWVIILMVKKKVEVDLHGEGLKNKI